MAEHTKHAYILVIDDDANIRELLDSMLSFAGFEVIAVPGAREAYRAIRDRAPDAVVLDVMLPDVDGFDFLHTLRASDAYTPVLFLTARAAVDDRVRGLASGGDDYVTKPFSMVEVEARLRALLRRSRLADSDAAQSHAIETPRLCCGDLVVDQERHLSERAGQPIAFSPTEFRLLVYLMVNQSRVVSKAQILEHVWNYDFGGDGRVVERFVSNIRHKIDAFGDSMIHTVRGFGYTIRAIEPE